MSNIQLDGFSGTTDTLVSNRFLDEYMPKANGEFVKIYLFLLRALPAGQSISICRIADIFNHTENDVLRALKYWEQCGLLTLTFDQSQTLCGIRLNPPGEEPFSSMTGSALSVPAPSSAISTGNAEPMPANVETENDSTFQKRAYSTNEITAFTARSEVSEFLYLTEKYVGKTLSHADVNSLLYMYDVLKFEPDLIEYLVEYCVTNGHKSIRYMEKVAQGWAEEGIRSVSMAKDKTALYIQSCYPVLKAFGLNGRHPGEGEKAMIIKWTNSYGFDMDLILDACNRTINTIHQPSFEYADSILSKWKEKGIHSLSEVKALDEQHSKNKQEQQKRPSGTQSQATAGSGKKNSFNNFEQREYDYQELEKKLLNNLS